jgi:hypothetical protein
VFDGRNVVDHQELAAIGFNVFCVGKGFIKANNDASQ